VTGLYRSDDSGATWRKLNDENPRPMYFSQVRVDPERSGHRLTTAASASISRSTPAKNVHVDIAGVDAPTDVHAIWIDPRTRTTWSSGNDGGLAVSWIRPKTWNFLPNLPVGLFYHVSVDNADAGTTSAAGMQDNYSWCGPSAVRGSAGIAGFHWQTDAGGDGFVALQDPNDFRIAYSESQDGNMVRHRGYRGGRARSGVMRGP